MQLDPVAGRVLGSLIEKHLTTPTQYPLSLNALTLACNQTSSRDPITHYDEGTVRQALDRLKADGLARFVLPSHGRSVVRYRHALEETLALDARQLALLAVLLLRGPQTVGELRTRTERMATFDGTDQVEADLVGLSRWGDPLVTRLERQPGQKEERWAHLLFDHDQPAARPDGGRSPAATDGLAEQMAELRAEVEDLRRQVEELKRALGG
jgi:uncharacterized protein YceH (UPF0502 family)